MDFSKVFKQVEQTVAENSPVILTSVGVVGTVATAVLTGRASYRAAALVDLLAVQDLSAGPITKKEIIKETWTLYIPPVGVGSVTVASIIFANRISSKRVAAMAVAYGISEKAFHEYKEKVVEHLGDKKEISLRDKIAQDKVNENPVDGREIIIAGAGEVLCYDALTGRYFMSTIETIKKAENKVNYDIIHHMYASLSSFYDEIGLPATSYSDEVGWNMDNILDVTYSTTMSTDGRPCIVIDFKVAPVTGYGKIY